MATVFTNSALSDYELPPEISAKFQDAQVLFCVSGKCDVGELLGEFQKFQISGNPTAPINRHLKNLFTQYGNEILSRIAKDDEDLFGNMAFALNEIASNARAYAFDAIAYPAHVNFGPNSDDADLPEKFDKDKLHPKGHVHAAILYSPAAGKICVLVQNFAVPPAVAKLIKRCAEVNGEIPRIRDDSEKILALFNHPNEEHAANGDEQPLLKTGGPIGSATAPIDYLGKNLTVTSHRTGTYMLQLHTENNNLHVLDTEAEFGMRSIADYPNAEAALNRAMEVAPVHQREDLRWVTTMATLSVPDEIRKNFPQP